MRWYYIQAVGNACPIEALDYIAAVEVHTALTAPEKEAICQLVRDFQGIGSTPSNSNFYSKMVEFYPIITTNASAQGIDMITLASWAVTEGTFTHTINGVYANGDVPSRINSNTSPGALGAQCAFDVWIYDDYTATETNAGRQENVGQNNGAQRFTIKAKTTTGLAEYAAYDSGTSYRTLSNSDATGFYTIQRNGDNAEFAKNGTVLDTWLTAGATPTGPVINMFRGTTVSADTPVPTTCIQSMFGIHFRMDATELADYFFALAKFQTAFGRNLI